MSSSGESSKEAKVVIFYPRWSPGDKTGLGDISTLEETEIVLRWTIRRGRSSAESNLRYDCNFMPIVQNELALWSWELVSAWELLSGAIRMPDMGTMRVIVMMMMMMMSRVLMISQGQRTITLPIGARLCRVRRNVGVQRCPPGRRVHCWSDWAKNLSYFLNSYHPPSLCSDGMWSKNMFMDNE